MPDLRPLAKWDDDQSLYEAGGKLIWWSRLDDRFQVEVQGDPQDDYRGTLVIFDKNDEMKLLLKEPVSVAYGAPFGADVADVHEWQERALKFIDDELPKGADDANGS